MLINGEGPNALGVYVQLFPQCSFPQQLHAPVPWQRLPCTVVSINQSKATISDYVIILVIIQAIQQKSSQSKPARKLAPHVTTWLRF